jgi:hypothetical protein
MFLKGKKNQKKRLSDRVISRIGQKNVTDVTCYPQEVGKSRIAAPCCASGVSRFGALPRFFACSWYVRSAVAAWLTQESGRGAVGNIGSLVL